MGMFKLNIRFTPKGLERLDEMRARLQDFTIPFNNMVSEWSTGNARKFARGKGAESTGVDQQLLSWEPLYANMGSISKESKRAYFSGLGALMTTPYPRAKRKAGYPDWLMVRTGGLRSVLCSKSDPMVVPAFEQDTGPKSVVFGTPLDSDAAEAAWGNRKTRPTIFLDRTDRGMIRREMQRFLSLGANYKALFALRSSIKAAAAYEIKVATGK